MFTFTCFGEDDLLLKSLFQQEAIKGGILAAGWHAPSYAHTADDVDVTLRIYDRVFKDIVTWVKDDTLQKHLVGKLVQPVFRKP